MLVGASVLPYRPLVLLIEVTERYSIIGVQPARTGGSMANWEEQFGIFLIPESHRSRFPATPNPAPDVWWQQSTRVDLQTINRTRVGQALLRAIKFHGVIVSIQKQTPGFCGDDTFPIEDDIDTGNSRLQITMGPTIFYAPEQHSLGHSCEKSRYGGFRAVLGRRARSASSRTSPRVPNGFL